MVLLFSCEKNDNTCNCNDPLKDLAWLKEIKISLADCVCQQSIMQGKYQEKTVFYIANTDPVGNSIFDVVLWDCNGNVVKEYKDDQQDVFRSEVESAYKIFTCSKK